MHVRCCNFIINWDLGAALDVYHQNSKVYGEQGLKHYYYYYY